MLMRLILARRRAIPVAAYVDFRGTYGQPWSYLRFRSKLMRTCTWRRSRLHLDHCHRIITAVLRLDEHKTHGKYQGSELDWNAWLQRYTDYVSLLIIAEVRPVDTMIPRCTNRWRSCTRPILKSIVCALCPCSKTWDVLDVGVRSSES